MNTSNPFRTETIARERQAEIARQLRQAAWLQGNRLPRVSVPLKRKLALGVASLSLTGLVAVILATLLR